jgi:large subunit ribosomal protein L9
MKVILLRDVAKIGRRSEIVDLSDGYALNQLIPKKWAEPATPANMKKIATMKATASLNDKLGDDQFQSAVASIQATPLQIVGGQANEQGHLFKAVHEADIVAAAKARGISILPAQIEIKASIKSLGSHEILLKRGTVSQSCLVEVIKAN